MKYRKKPVVVDAMQFLINVNDKEVAAFIGSDNLEPVTMLRKDCGCEEGGDNLQIRTLEGVMTARNGDYIIRGIKGEIYPCKPDIFHATYEAANDQ